MRCLVRPAIGSDLAGVLCGLTFELRRHQRCDARARMAKMYRVPPAGPAWHAVGARLERGVRQRCAQGAQAGIEPKEPQPLVSCTRRLPLRAAGRRAHAAVIDRVLADLPRCGCSAHADRR